MTAAVRARPRAAVMWSPATMRVVTYSLVTLQLVQGSFTRASNPLFVRSYWAANYRYGFIRRGLAGEVLRLIVGTPSRFAADTAGWIVALAAVAAVVVLIDALIRCRTTGAWVAALLLAASPFVLDYLTFQRRPDQLGVVFLALFGLGIARSSAHSRAVVVWCAGPVAALLVLAHETVALIAVPWAFALLVATARDSDGAPDPDFWRLSAALLVPPVIAFGAVTAFGTATTRDAHRLAADVSWIPAHAATVLDFLAIDPGRTTNIGLLQPMTNRITTLVAGGILFAAQAACLWVWARPGLLRCAASSRPRLAGIGSVVAIVVGTVMLFRSGTDWLRWCAAVGCAWLLCATSLVLARSPRRAPQEPAPQIGIPIAVVIVAVLLALLFPLTDTLVPGDIGRLIWRS